MIYGENILTDCGLRHLASFDLFHASSYSESDHKLLLMTRNVEMKKKKETLRARKMFWIINLLFVISGHQSAWTEKYFTSVIGILSCELFQLVD